MSKIKKWIPLFLSNFLGVFNDNLLKNSIIFTGIFWVRPEWLSESQLISIVSASLVLPYLIFSPLGGRLAAIYPKKKVFVFFKLSEIPVMLLAAISFYYQLVFLSIFAVFFMGILSSMYSPAKYGLIKDIAQEDVSYGSGGFETMAFLGILLGTFIASIISDHYNFLLIAFSFVAIAFAGYRITTQIRVTEQPVAPDNANGNPIKFVFQCYKFAKAYKHVNSSVFGASAFWLIGSLIQMNLIIHSHLVYNAPNTQTGIIMGIAALGIAAGTYSAGIISGNKPKKGLVLFGLTGMFLSLLLITLMQINWYAYAALVFTTTFSGGIFQVPNLSVIQNANLGRKSGDVFAYLNMFTFILILMGAALFSLLTYLTHQNSTMVFEAILLIILGVALFFFLNSSEYRNESRSDFERLFRKSDRIS